MYLKKVEISGFKSFADKTVLDFRSINQEAKKAGEEASGFNAGITAVVGPNGSGKSNIADAIRWVMGEQSMKNLRGKKSEDIIFAGSGSKGKLGYATASLHFDNSDKKIPLDFSEVIISRKLFRSGEAEYLINGSRVRLIDVVDILAKAGIGRDSYSVVNQGMSDAVLNATPVERRAILEDAAGVKQYQIKKIRALKKLETTKKNLEQVEVMLQEIEPHLRSLKRQANKSLKSKEIKTKLREVQEKYFAFLWNQFSAEREKSLLMKDELGREMMNLQRTVDTLNDFVQTESQKIRVNEMIGELKTTRDKQNLELNKVERESILTDGKMEILREQIRQQNIVRSVPVDKKYIQEKLAEVINSQRKLVERITGIEKLEELQDIKEFATAVKQVIFDLRGNIEKGEVAGEKSKEQIAKEKKLQIELEKVQKQKNESGQNVQKLREKIIKTDKDIEVEVKKDEDARQKLFQTEDKLRASRQKLDQAKDKFNEAKISLARIEIREDDLRADAQNDLQLDIEKLVDNGSVIDRFDIERKISRMKMQLEQAGGIDPLVVDEYRETNERYETLQQESKDLAEAIISLREVAKEMDRKIAKVFTQAFKTINQEFSKYFKIIFGGGSAKLVKVKSERRKKKNNLTEQSSSFEGNSQQGDGEIDDNNIIEKEEAEIGIDIFANPPGKKISNLAMLSGGERALTSLALLFAIIAYNPPPFAVLDEVEAGLDEANSRRFGKILQKLSNDTQFVAITHNRETMKQASFLYGVTMGDDGVSKILSIKLDK